jgi:hypothetical protein
MRPLRLGTTATLAAALALAGCGTTAGTHSGPITAAAKAPWVAAEHRDLHAYCDAYTPSGARQLVQDLKPPTHTPCQVALRPFVVYRVWGAIDARILAHLHITHVSIHGSHASAWIQDASSRGYTMSFARGSDGRWRISHTSLPTGRPTQVG